MTTKDFETTFNKANDEIYEKTNVCKETLMSYIKYIQGRLNIDHIEFDAGAFLPVAREYGSGEEVSISRVKMGDNNVLYFSDERISKNDWVIAYAYYDFDAEDVFNAVFDWVEPRRDLIDMGMENDASDKTKEIMDAFQSRDTVEKFLACISDEENSKEDIKLFLKRLELIAETDNGHKPVKGRYCPHCGAPLYAETDLDIDYPYVCHVCDENFYTFETDSKPNPQVSEEVETNDNDGKKTFRIRYAMEKFVNADSIEDADRIFSESEPCGDFIEIEDISEW